MVKLMVEIDKIFRSGTNGTTSRFIGGPLVKYAGNGLLFFAMAMGQLGCALSATPYEECLQSEERAFKTYIGILSCIQISEMFYHGLKAYSYNSRLEESKNEHYVTLTPTVWDDRVGMAMQVNF